MRMAEVRKSDACTWLRPDGRADVVVEYGLGEDTEAIPVRIHTVILSCQHASPDAIGEAPAPPNIQEELMQHVVRPVLPPRLVDDRTVYHINPSGRFVIGGPHGNAGLTGRQKGGACASGRDPTKVNRFGTYLTRWIAKSLVDAGLCRRCTVQLTYVAGLPGPVSLSVDSHGCAARHDFVDEDLCEVVEGNFDLRPGAAIRQLGLCKPRYRDLAVHGCLAQRGQVDALEWEACKDIDSLRLLVHV